MSFPQQQAAKGRFLGELWAPLSNLFVKSEIFDFPFLFTFQNSAHFHHKRLLLWHVQTARAARCHDSPSEDSGIRLCLGGTFHLWQIHRSLKSHHISCFADNGSGVTVHV